MQIILFRFKVSLYLAASLPQQSYYEAGIHYDGNEEHIEHMYASDREVAIRAMRKYVLRRLGVQKRRLSYLNISEPEEVNNR